MASARPKALIIEHVLSIRTQGMLQMDQALRAIKCCRRPHMSLTVNRPTIAPTYNKIQRPDQLQQRDMYMQEA